MPLDQRGFEIETRPGVFTIEGMVAWLETQSPEDEYNFWDCGGYCLAGLYLAAIGQWQRTANSYLFENSPGGDNAAIRYWGNILIGNPWTFGGALTRARQALRDRAQP